ncbi:MAG: hypothetical protein K2K23_00665 [Muribaculaceae bacterium]|nr:hypothetical protein [Muribaculaceae bacterium]
MWTIFKIVNLWWLLTSTYAWPMLSVPLLLLLIVANAGMIISLSFLPIKFSVDSKTGWILLAMLGLTLWSTWLDGWSNGMKTVMQYLPVLYLVQLPYEYMKDLLKFTTKWYAILLIPGLLLYWITLFIPLPSIGTFVHEGYLPYTNYIFYIQSTFDEFRMARFNGFFLEPGHLAIVSTFLMMANHFDFKKCPWNIIMAVSVLFSLSLAGYLLALIGFIMLKINSISKGLITLGIIGVIVAGALSWSGGDNTLNEMIISRMEYDQNGGIKGNNRFYNNTDYEFKRVKGTEYFWTSVKGKANMDLISGAGYKIYILHYGMIGTILALLFYISVIPSKPDYRYTISFFILIALCFMQRAYPFWYSWLFPYVVGIYIAKNDKARRIETKQEYIS